jgi:hypothetical protein
VSKPTYHNQIDCESSQRSDGYDGEKSLGIAPNQVGAAVWILGGVVIDVGPGK